MLPVAFTIPLPTWLARILSALGIATHGTLDVHTYGVTAALAFVAAIVVARAIARRDGLDLDQITRLTAKMTCWGLLGGRMAFAVLNWDRFADAPLAVLDPRVGGFVFQGGLLTATVVGWLLVRRSPWSALRIGDLAMPCVAIANAVGRLGCFAAGCCYGTPTTLPWGVSFDDPRSLAPLHVQLHAVQLYECAGDFVIFAICVCLLRARLARGRVFAFYFLAYPALRIALECLRGDDDRGFVFPSRLGHAISASQAVALVEILICATLVTVLSRRANGANRFHQGHEEQHGTHTASCAVRNAGK